MHLGTCSKPMSRSRPGLGLTKIPFSECNGQPVKFAKTDLSVSTRHQTSLLQTDVSCWAGSQDMVAFFVKGEYPSKDKNATQSCRSSD